MFKITLLFVSSGLNNFLKTAYMKFLHEKLFLIPWGQLFFHYELLWIIRCSMAVRDRDWQRAGLLCCWVMIVTLRNKQLYCVWFWACDNNKCQKMRTVCTRIWKIPLIKNEISVNRAHLKLSADLLVRKLLQTRVRLHGKQQQMQFADWVYRLTLAD